MELLLAAANRVEPAAAAVAGGQIPAVDPLPTAAARVPAIPAATARIEPIRRPLSAVIPIVSTEILSARGIQEEKKKVIASARGLVSLIGWQKATRLFQKVTEIQRRRNLPPNDRKYSLIKIKH